MVLFIASFIAGIITILTPCVFTLLPIIVGGSLARSSEDEKASYKRPVTITLSLIVSLILFTLLLKASTALLMVPDRIWMVVSGLIVLFLGVNFLWPEVWKRIPGINLLFISSNKAVGSSLRKNSLRGDILIGLSLGPVFNSCSPTYALVVAAVLPSSFGQGLLYLLAYCIGLGGALLCLAVFGQSLLLKFKSFADPHGWFMKSIGVLFIAIGISILSGFDRYAQGKLLETGLFDPVVRLEEQLR